MKIPNTEKLNPKELLKIIQKLREEGRLPSQEKIILALENAARLVGRKIVD